MDSKSIILLALVVSLFSTPAVLLTSSNTVGIHPDFPHARVVVTRVVDGDTIHIAPAVCVAGSYRTVVRLADIQAPELDQPEGIAARDALIGLLAQYDNIVYLDIANYSIAQGCSSGHVDMYGRVIAVIYVRVNDTTLLNVNKWLVENNHASIVDYQDDFDPNKWSLHVNYHVQNEKLPTITKTTLFTRDISYATLWGVRVATTPDKKYLGVAFSEGSPDYALNVLILDNNGNIIANHRVSNSNVWRGMLDIAANDTGFLVVWNDAGITRTARFIYVPITGNPTSPQTIDSAITYSYHPLVAFYNNGTVGYWVIIYGKQTTTYTRINTTWYYASSLSFHRNYWWGVAPGGNSSSHRVGLDVVSGIIVHSKINKFIVVARNYTDTTGHDIIGITGSPSTSYGIYISRFNIDNSTGDQGPEPDLGPNSYTYFNLYPSIHSKSLLDGNYTLVVYNATSSKLSYAIINMEPATPTVSRGDIIDRGEDTTFYPWIASNETSWFVSWNAGGWINASVITTSGVQSRFVIADSNSSYVRVAYDPATGKYIIPFGVTDETGFRNLFVAFYNTSSDRLEPWILPVSTTKNQHETPLHVVVLSGPEPDSPGRIAIVALEGNSLVVYLISETYPELQTPIPIPEPWILILPVSVVVVVASYFVLLRRRKLSL